MIESIDPCDLIAPHDVSESQLLSDLIEGMAENGWNGRPLLVIEAESGLYAWTGSHRIRAAIEAELSSVPCYVIPESDLPEGHTADEAFAADFERIEVIDHAGDRHAASLMRLEEH